MKAQAFFDLLLYKTRANLRAEVSQLYLNFAWWALEPLFSMAVFYVVFGIFMNSSTPHFALFLLIGTTQWQWFSATVLHASTSISGAGALIQRVSLPKVFFPLEIFLQDSFKHLFVLALLGLFLCLSSVPVTSAWLALPVVLALQGLLILTCSILFAGLVPFLPDLRFILGTVMNVLFFVSGIFFNINAFVLPQHTKWMYCNPMAGILREYRQIIINGQWPDWGYLAGVFAGVLVLLALALYLVFRLDKQYPRICQQ